MNAGPCSKFNHEGHRGHEELFSFSLFKAFMIFVSFVVIQRSLRARKSSRGSSKLQLPKDLTNLRRYCSRSTSICHSRHAKKSSVNKNDRGFSSSSIITACSASQ